MSLARLWDTEGPSLADMGGESESACLPLARSCMCPIRRKVAMGALTSLNILFEPRGVNFASVQFSVCLAHWDMLGWGSSTFACMGVPTARV